MYLYVRNLQCDVVEILDSSGNVIHDYEYDAYSNVLDISEPEGSTIGQINSIRYRSYRFDSEINMYYLNSRYYVPELGRFLNADGLLGPVGNILGHNMYAYCANNPVMYTDSDGYAPEWFVDALSIIATVAVVTIIVIAAASTGGIAGAALLSIAMGISIGSIDGAADAIKNDTSIAAGVISGGFKGGATGAALALGLLVGGGLIYGVGSIIASFSAALGINFVAGAFSNTIYESLNGRTPDLLQSCVCGFTQMLNGAALFGAGVIVGSTGFVNTPGVKRSFEIWLRNTLSMESQKIYTYYLTLFATSLVFSDCR